MMKRYNIAPSLVPPSLAMAVPAPVLLALAQRLDAAVAALQRGETAAYEERFAQCLSLLGCRVRVRCGSVVSGVLEAIDLRGLRLDGGRTFALAQVQELRGE